MAKKSVPKQKKSKSHTRKQHAAWSARETKRLVEQFQVVECPKCKSPKLNHAACPECGYYRGRKVVEKGTSTKSVTKVKA